MQDTPGSSTPGKDAGTGSLARKTWPLLITGIPQPFVWWATWLAINMLVFSDILWPGAPFNGQALGVYYGGAVVIQAFSRMAFGNVVDRVSRRKMMGIFNTAEGLVFCTFGFIPAGQGDTSFNALLLLTIAFAVVSGGASTGPDSPVTNSFIDDAVDEHSRSAFFGILVLANQVSMVVGTIVAAAVFKEHWRTYFWIVGLAVMACGATVGLKGFEPKRGAAKSELKSILRLREVTYTYQITRETFRSTLLSPTNIIAFMEGVFTTMILAVPGFVITPFLQSAPLNFSPLSQSMIGVIFGIPGAVIGAMVFARFSDKAGKKNIKNRVWLIFVSLVIIYVGWQVVVLVPWPALSVDEGASIAGVLQYPMYWLLCALMFVAQMTGNLYAINQRPIIQKINLPEAQGLITGGNVFLETLGRGLGMIIAGTVLALFNLNYQATVLVLLLFGMVGAVMWLFTLRFIDRDVARVSAILTERAGDLARGKHEPDPPAGKPGTGDS